MLKKILKVLGVIVILLIAAIIVLPIVFKDDIIAKIKEEANNNLNAKVDFGDFDLSLIRNFPNFSFYIKDVKVDGVGEFEGITLAKIGELNLSLDLMSVISGGEMDIKTIELHEPNLHVIVTKEGKANYDIAKETEGGEVEEEVTEEAAAEEGDFKMALQKFLISKANIIYDDREGNMYAHVENLNFDLSGDFTADFTSLKTKTSIDALTYKMDGIPYLNKTEVEIKADVDADLANSKYTFKENEFRLNQLILGLNGWLTLVGEEDMEMDLAFEAKKTEFKNILSLIPAVYSKEFESVKTEGTLALNGFAKGTMAGEQYPAFGVKLLIENAMFKYPDLPQSVNNIQVAVDVNSSGGDLDNTIVNVSKFHVEMAGNPFDLNLLLKTPMSDPYIKAGFDGTLVLSSIKDIVPLEEGDELSGTITTDIHLEGNQSTIDNEQYENFKAEGSLLVSAMTYKSKELPYSVVINNMDMSFSPQYVSLNAFDSKVGKSDFRVNGRLENFIPYALSDSAVLKGVLNVNSTMLDLTEFMEEEEESTAAAGEGEAAPEAAAEEPMEVVEVPGDIDFEMNANFAAIHMDSLDISNLAGKIVVRNSKMALQGTSMNMLGGGMKADGFYETTNPAAPTFDFDMAIDKFDVQQTVTTFNTVEEMAPLFKGATGQYSTALKITGTLNQNMEPKYETLYGNGSLQTHDVKVKSFKALAKIADKLKKEELKEIDMQNVNITYEIKEGKVFLDPFDVKVGNTKVTISGWNSFDQTLEYNMDIAIPRSEFGGAANQAAEQLFSSLTGKLGVDAKLPDIIKMRAQVTGNVDDPKVTIVPAGTEGGDTGDSMKDKLKDELDKKKKEAEARAREEAEKLKREAEAKKKQVEEEARKKAEEAKKKAQEEAERKKREAEQKAKEEAERAKKKAEEEAKKKLKGVFK